MALTKRNNYGKLPLILKVSGVFYLDKREQSIVELLQTKSGNVNAVAEELGLSNSYVSRIKRKHLKEIHEIPETTVQLPAAMNREARDLLPPDIKRIEGLRSKAVDTLFEQIDRGAVEPKDIVRLLEVILRYETNINRVNTPTQNNFFQDNRNQILVDKLADMDPEQLRALAGMPDPIDLKIIDGKVVTHYLDEDEEAHE